MVENISIIGAGGFGREVKQLIDEINLSQKIWSVEGFYDSLHEPGTLINDVPVLGGNEDPIRSDCKNFVLAMVRFELQSKSYQTGSNPINTLTLIWF